jgi:23S rRNA (adenine2503-C2)-methyltransferase
MIEDDINERISSVVIMGIGEPFDNYDNIMDFIRIINDPLGIAIGARHITVSTSGIVPKIKEYAHENIQTNLAISLHAPNNEIRDRIMKINKAYKLEELIDAIKYYIDETNRRVTIEYVMLKDVNDSVECANELSDVLRAMSF